MRLLILTSAIVLLFASAQGLVIEAEKRGIQCERNLSSLSWI